MRSISHGIRSNPFIFYWVDTFSLY
ncbi:CRISPR-associated DxTHG motif protein [Aliivibrio fischeri]|nr:CRISPR-associated DxTHG motif protein [Aliivibrio fischeri]MBP3142550.1 CRISPR-associated DxTHG motif protein [Aliivibrio fischeri]MBP3142552.1 CRISPR-associated DxTHG motif protein [Aliivibrio fischeri]MBP3156825.1 CRISPR-associated DxTHG motif protein [Aliivibrio fischeri]MBP3156827.1 CRISPR-associated DxTHG motif protein [Aliivibrio fischeri]